jgi:nucleoid-associated protein YgaU
MGRYDGRIKFKNTDPLYETTRKKKGVTGIEQYASGEVIYPSISSFQNLTVVNHVWKRGDKFYKLANTYYKDPTMWWVIAQFNKSPTEAGIDYGDLIMVPTPLETILNMYRGSEY